MLPEFQRTTQYVSRGRNKINSTPAQSLITLTTTRFLLSYLVLSRTLIRSHAHARIYTHTGSFHFLLCSSISSHFLFFPLLLGARLSPGRVPLLPSHSHSSYSASRALFLPLPHLVLRVVFSRARALPPLRYPLPPRSSARARRHEGNIRKN